MDKVSEYRKYIREHRNTVSIVFKFWLKTDDSKVFSEDEISILSKNIYNHDLSKYDDEEFEPYRKKFFPIDGETSDKKEFSMAWNHHQKSNPHHWQYWILPKKIENEAIPIPMCYVVEMLCDWTAMSIQKGGSVTNWFLENEPEMILNPSSKGLVAKLLPEFEKIYILVKGES